MLIYTDIINIVNHRRCACIDFSYGTITNFILLNFDGWGSLLLEFVFYYAEKGKSRKLDEFLIKLLKMK